MALIWSCPQCWEDLEDHGWNLWCATCEREVSWYEFAGLDPDDERSDFMTEEYADGRP